MRHGAWRCSFLCFSVFFLLPSTSTRTMCNIIVIIYLCFFFILFVAFAHILPHLLSFTIWKKKSVKKCNVHNFKHFRQCTPHIVFFVLCRRHSILWSGYLFYNLPWVILRNFICCRKWFWWTGVDHFRRKKKKWWEKWLIVIGENTIRWTQKKNQCWNNQRTQRKTSYLHFVFKTFMAWTKQIGVIR